MTPATRFGNEIGASRPGIYRSRQEYLDNKKTMIKYGHIDNMLTSAADGEVLARTSATQKSDASDTGR